MQAAGLAAVSDAFRALCIGVDSPRSLKAAMLLKHGEYRQLAEMKIHPSEYVDPETFAGDYLVSVFLKKNRDLPAVADTRQEAISTFARAESQCKATNARLADWMEGRTNAPLPVAQVIHLAQRKISRLLVEGPKLYEGPYDWGPGATIDLKRSSAYPDTKLFALPLSVTGSAWKHAAKIIDSDLHWKETIVEANSSYTGNVFNILPGGRYDTVPKTVLTDRSILVEPRLNSFLQKRIGLQLRGLLKRVDVDLNDQSRNQILAGMAHQVGLATIDLESASDTVSRRVVELLLPPDWYEILDDLRSKWYLDDQKVWVRLEKFSSMGNGFTFELESLIYWAIASAVSEISFHSIVGVYGDDIIVHQDCVPLLREVLAFLGFSVNATKSFWEGNFFESCGKHYFGGYDVTPAYQKCIPTDGAEAARMGNRLLRVAARLGRHGILDKRIRGSWESWRRSWRPSFEQCGPYVGEGEGYWELPSSELASLPSRTRSGAAGIEYLVKSYRVVAREIPADDNAMLAIWLMGNKSVTPHEVEKDYARKRRMLIPPGDPLVTVKGTSRKLVITSTLPPSGMQASRIKTPERSFHGWVARPLAADLDW